MQPFVSISGVSTKQELEGIVDICNQERFDFPIAIGYQFSSKSINKGTKNPRQPRYDEFEELNRITTQSGLITAVHYYTKKNSSILPDVSRLARETKLNPEQTLLQLNTLPPSRQVLKKLKQKGFKLIFKVPIADKGTGRYAIWKGATVEDTFSGDAMKLVGEVDRVKEHIDYAMFDPSHGTNLGLDLSSDSVSIRFGDLVNNIVNTELAVQGDNHQVGLVYAGGIGPRNVEPVVRKLKTEFPKGFSIDTESAIRIKDKLDLGLVRDYLIGYRKGIAS